MIRHCKRGLFLGVTCLLAAVLAATCLQAAVLKNKKTGEILKGTLTEGVINNKRIVKLDTGGSRFIDIEDWEIVEPDAPAETPQTDTTTTETTETKEAPTEPVKVVKVHMIPIKGAIMYSSILTGLEKALDEAKKKKAELLVFHMDTPGGRVDLGDKIIGLIDAVDWARTVAWVEGSEENGAISCGAYISLCLQAIYMAPGTTLGGAVPYSIQSGSAEVDEKMQSIFRARFRALAQKRGHPASLADAMVDSSVSVVQVFIDGNQRLVSEEEVEQLKKDHKEKFRRGKTVCRAGKVLTLTANEAKEFGIARDIAKDFDELMSEMEIEKYTLTEASWLPDFVKTQAESGKKSFEKFRTTFNMNWQLANQNDPQRQSYYVKEDMSFTDGGRRWKEYSEKCLGYLRTCAEALKGIEKLSQMERSDYNFPEELFNDWKVQLQTMFDRVHSQRNSKAMP